MIWNNIKTTHHRWMASWLKRQGWVCFYLEPQFRHCPAVDHNRRDFTCWLALYEQGERHARPKV
jgi:hypothetical protein